MSCTDQLRSPAHCFAHNLYTLFYKNQEMSNEARMFLNVIHSFSNSHPTPTPITCLKCFSWSKVSFGKFSYSYFKFLENFHTKFEARCSYKKKRVYSRFLIHLSTPPVPCSYWVTKVLAVVYSRFLDQTGIF